MNSLTTKRSKNVPIEQYFLAKLIKFPPLLGTIPMNQGVYPKANILILVTQKSLFKAKPGLGMGARMG